MKKNESRQNIYILHKILLPFSHGESTHGLGIPPPTGLSVCLNPGGLILQTDRQTFQLPSTQIQMNHLSLISMRRASRYFCPSARVTLRACVHAWQISLSY